MTAAGPDDGVRFRPAPHGAAMTAATGGAAWSAAMISAFGGRPGARR
jgi:hypothetical protein